MGPIRPARGARAWVASEGGAALALDEVTHQLSGRGVATATELEGAAFPEALESHAVERVHRALGGAVLPVVLRGDAHHDAGVGVALVA